MDFSVERGSGLCCDWWFSIKWNLWQHFLRNVLDLLRVRAFYKFINTDLYLGIHEMAFGSTFLNIVCWKFGCYQPNQFQKICHRLYTIYRIKLKYQMLLFKSLFIHSSFPTIQLTITQQNFSVQADVSSKYQFVI